jgi:hypothetical protein
MRLELGGSLPSAPGGEGHGDHGHGEERPAARAVLTGKDPYSELRNVMSWLFWLVLRLR